MAYRHGPSDDEFREEIEAHIALETDRLIADGVSAQSAASAARRTFGNVTRVRERFYESRRFMWLEDARQDTRVGFRSLRRSPGFMAIAVVMLAMGLGANTAIFSVLNAVVLRPLAYKSADQLVLIEHPPLGGSPLWLRDAWRARARTLSDFTTFEPSSPGTVVVGNEPFQVDIARVAPNFFLMLGITPAFGRTFSVIDTQRNAPPVAVLSHSFWVHRFGGQPEILGTAVRLTDVAITGAPVVIVGVLPRDFRFPVADPPDHIPLFPTMQPDIILLSASGGWQQVVGRLSRGSTPAAASTELTGIFKQEASAYFAASFVERTPVGATPLHDRLVGDTRRRLLLVMAAVGCVLLVVCANIANLLLARVTRRQPEFAVRTALGARTGRLIRMILTESLLLAAFGAIGALLLAWCGGNVLRSMLAARVSFVDTVPIDWWVLWFNTALASATGVLSGLASLVVIRSKRLASHVSGAGRSVTRPIRLRHVLLVAEIGTVFVLVVTAALLCETLWNLQHSKRGFDGDHVLTAGVMPGMSGTIPEVQRLTTAFFDRVIEQVGRVPGVESAAAASTVPLGGPTIGMSGVSVVGRPPVGGGGASVSVAAVTPDFFATTRIKLLAGRDFGRLDQPNRERVTIVNEAFARGLASEPPLLGARIQFGRSVLTVVGIVEDTPDTSLRQPARPFVYVPLAQTIGSSFAFGRLTILARARGGDPATLIPGVREALWALGHDMVIDEVSTMNQRLAAATRTERDTAMLFGLLAALAVLVAVAGVYGVVAYSVSQRTREMGIRMALGARHRQVVGEIVRESAWPVAIGIALGMAGAVASTRAVVSILFEIKPTDLSTYAVTMLALSLTALTAAWIPARRAAKVDPVLALRAE